MENAEYWSHTWFRRGRSWVSWIVGSMGRQNWEGAYYTNLNDAWRFSECLERHLLLLKHLKVKV